MKQKTTLYVLLLIFVKSAILSAQERLAQANYILEVPQGFVLESLSGYGYNNTTINTTSNICNTNPANLLGYNRISFGVSFQVESKIKKSLVADVSHYRKNLALPQSFSLIVPLKRVGFGLGFNQKYNSEKDYGEITITKVDTSNPSRFLKIGTVEGFKICLLFDHSFSLAYTFKNIIDDNDNFEVGLKFNYYQLVVENKLIEKDIIPEYQNNNYSFNDKHTYDEFSFAIGSKYRLENLQVGFVYERGADFNKKTKMYYRMRRLPDKYSSGIILNLSTNINIAGGLNYVILDNPVSDYYGGVKNQIESYGNIIFKYFNKIAFSSGFFRTNYRYWRTSDVVNDRYNAWYFIAGFIFLFKYMDFDLVLADSHLFSGEFHKQTIFKVGMGFKIE